MKSPSPPTARYARRREEILEVASRQINANGTRGMTLTAVARELGLDTSSVTYYFKRKDDLAAACLARTLEWQLQAARRAASEPDPPARVAAFLRAHFELHRHQRDPAVARLAVLSDIGALADPQRGPVEALLARLADAVAAFFRPAADADHARFSALVVLANVYWMTVWTELYLLSDFPRIEARLFALLAHGLAGEQDWPLACDAPLEAEDDDTPLGRFLHAATNLINRRGYTGASVERIAAELGLTTGSFYHHLANKDDLVLACFDRSLAAVNRARERAQAAGGPLGAQVMRLCASVIAFQLTGASPMLRVGAYHALPPDLRLQTLQRTRQASRQVAGMIADAIAEGSLAPVDPSLASHAIVAMFEAAAELRDWAQTHDPQAATARLYALLGRGLFPLPRPAASTLG